MTPFSPVNSHPGSTHSSSAGSSETHPLVLDHLTSSGSRRSSDIDYARHLSEVSGSSVEGSLSDPALVKSLNKFKRCLEVEKGLGMHLSIFLYLWLYLRWGERASILCTSPSSLCPCPVSLYLSLPIDVCLPLCMSTLIYKAKPWIIMHR